MRSGGGRDTGPRSCVARSGLGPSRHENSRVRPSSDGERDLSVVEVIEFIVRLEDDPARRVLLDGAPSSLFLAAVEHGLVDRTDMPEFARVIGECVTQGLLTYAREMAASHLPPPEQPWTDYAFQMRSGYHSTVRGQQLVELVVAGPRLSVNTHHVGSAPRDLAPFLKHMSLTRPASKSEVVIGPIRCRVLAKSEAFNA